MKRVLLLIPAMALLLAGCGKTTAVEYDVAFNVQEPGQRTQLMLMSQNVIQRRLENMGETGETVTATATEQGAKMIVHVRDPIIADALTGQLTEPFTLDIMKEAPEGKGDITVSGHGSFMKTSVNAMHITWITAQPQVGSTMAMVTIGFSPEGRILMQKLFKENKGKFVGIFVRGKLVSKLRVETDELKEDVVIQDIPSYDLASVFADDVNVGLHAVFTTPTL